MEFVSADTMKIPMRIALAQVNTTVGDLEGNASKILEYVRQADAAGAELVAFPELALTGYPPRDLVEKDAFLDRTAETLDRLREKTATFNTAVIVGYVARTRGDAAIKAQNAAAVLHRGQVIFDQRKMLLPTYDVFDEVRYFQPAEKQGIFTLNGTRIALAICEDFWNDKQFWERRRYSRDPIEELVSAGCRSDRFHQCFPLECRKAATETFDF